MRIVVTTNAGTPVLVMEEGEDFWLAELVSDKHSRRGKSRIDLADAIVRAMVKRIMSDVYLPEDEYHGPIHP